MDLDQVHFDWREREDPERAVFVARQQLAKLSDSRELSIDAKIAAFEVLIEPMLDGPDGSPMIVFKYAGLLAKEVQRVELAHRERLSELRRVGRRVSVSKFRIRALLCAQYEDQAMRHCMAGITFVENLAGGRDQLVAAMGRRPNAVADNALALIGPTAGVLRGAQLPSATRDIWVRKLRSLVTSYIPGLDASRAYIYPGTPSVVQVLFLLAWLGDPEDAALIEALHELDKRARPSDCRAQATIPRRDLAVAQYRGDRQEASALEAKAISNFATYPLERHLRGYQGRGFCA